MYFILFKNWYKAELETILNKLNADWLFLLIFCFCTSGLVIVQYNSFLMSLCRAVKVKPHLDQLFLKMAATCNKG